MKPPHRKMLLWALLAAVFCVWVAWCRLNPGPEPSPSPRLGPAPSAAIQELLDVVEPITIVLGVSFTDGGSIGFRFQGARGKTENLSLKRFAFYPPEPPAVVVFGSFSPGSDVHHDGWASISGVDERALLGLLERWAADDPHARELERRFDLVKSRRLTVHDFWAGQPEDVEFKAYAVSILRTLRSRNQGRSPK
jgi:hypothetical protein